MSLYKNSHTKPLVFPISWKYDWAKEVNLHPEHFNIFCKSHRHKNQGNLMPVQLAKLLFLAASQSQRLLIKHTIRHTTAFPIFTEDICKSYFPTAREQFKVSSWFTFYNCCYSLYLVVKGHVRIYMCSHRGSCQSSASYGTVSKRQTLLGEFHTHFWKDHWCACGRIHKLFYIYFHLSEISLCQ